MNIHLTKILTIFSLSTALFLGGCVPGDSTSSGGNSNPSNSGGGSTVSQSGSTAAMLIHGNALYVLDTGVFKVFDISSQQESKLAKMQPVKGAETLFVYENYLYIGGQFGVDIWNIENPLDPVQENFYAHVRGCDPIIVKDDIGYITLRNRPGCSGDTNRLEVVDFSNPTEPKELLRYPMKSPYGLANMGDYLAVCQENYGLSILNVSITEANLKKSAEVEEVSEFKTINCFDLIYRDNILLVTAKDGIYQLTVDDSWVTPLSKIPVGG